MKLVKTLIFATLISLGFSSAFAQGVTKANISGTITIENNEGLEGATVIATHTPSGTRYGSITRQGGAFYLPNLRVGGPYTVKVTYIGYEDAVFEGVYLTLGQTRRIDVNMKEASSTLDDVLITSSRSDIFDGNRTGQETVIDEQTINSLPTISRSIADFARYNPLVNVGESNDGFSFSIGGQNNRYNAIYIDGSVNNDVFGLSGSGTDGGQTGASAISLDAIEQFQVSVAPFDVRLSGFAGGAVNAITRSGTNQVDASAYYFLRNESLAGKTPGDLPDDDRSRLNDFSAQTFGFRVGAPIIKDKLFFFANAEFQRDEIPEPFDFNNYLGDATQGDLDALINKLNGFGYDPGTFTENATTLDKNFFLLRLDWNINENHKLSLRHFVNDIENLEARNSTPTGIRFQNGSEYFLSTTNNTALEINSVFGSRFSNKLQVGLKFVRDDRDVFGDPFPWVRITDGAGQIEFGGERFSSANRLDQDVITITDDFQIFSGNHNITIGTQNEIFSVGNLFIRENFGAYRYFDGLNDFLNDSVASQFDRSYSQVDNVAGDESNAIASFSGFQLGFYVQDEWQATQNFKLTAGIRFDIPVFTDDVPENNQFNSETISSIEAVYGADALRGARTGQFIGTQVQIAPRIGFNWNVGGQSMTQVRGGVGIFNSRQPLVWFGGAYNNYGFNIGGTRLRNQVVFNPDVQNQPPGAINVDNPSPSGQIDLFAEDFKLPQVLKANLAVDQKLPGGFIATAEALFTGTLNNVRYESLNLRPAIGNLTGTGDNRPIFNVFDPVDPTYTGIYLASNTNKGYAYNIAVSLSKPFNRGFLGTISYSYGDSYSINDGTSSQNNSQWRNYQNVEGRNLERDPARSTFSPGHRVFSSLTYRKEYAGFGATALTLTYNGQSGQTFTYTIDDNGFGGMVNDGSFNDENQFYVPNNRNDIILVDIDGGETADQQWAKLDAFINGDSHLSEMRGDYADINSSRVPFNSIFDVKLVQEFFLKMKNGQRNTVQLSLDIFNFGNFLNKNWGNIYFSPNFGNFNLVRFRGFEDNTNNPTYTVDPRILGLEDPANYENDDLFGGNRIDTGRLRSSRWQMQFGVRYTFN
ncbi:MAG: carboxypeptidase regulatory-like domain-containing protein [Bacteroidota bacterium]